MKITKVFAVLLAILLLGPLAKFILKDHLEGNNIPHGLEIKSDLENTAVIQIYGADAGQWQSYFSLHMWIALKKNNEEQFTIYEVLRDRPAQGLPAISIWQGNPNRPWVGHRACCVYHLEGENAVEIIPQIEKVIASYPFHNVYTVWPGPNCNTFIAYIARAIPKLGLTLPPNAIGKDFLLPGVFFTNAPSGTGYQFSLFGLLGVTLASKEGLEIDFLGLNFGFEPNNFTLLAPGIGKIPFVTTQ